MPVAPYAGAWIETLIPSMVMMIRSGRPLAGAWIETPVLRGWLKN